MSKTLWAAVFVSLLKVDPLWAWVNDQNALNVLGEPNLTTQIAATTATGMKPPEGIAYDPVGQQLFVSDQLNNRVLIFDLSGSPSITNGMAASHVLGQPDFFSSAPNTTQNDMRLPTYLAYDSSQQRLFVSDQGNNRVLVFVLTSGVTDYMPASYELGQTTWTTSTYGTSQTEFLGPNGLAYDPANHRLFVGDYGNNRVMVFDYLVSSNNPPAVHVLGQSDFVTQSTNGGAAGPTSQGINQVMGISMDPVGQRLFVADATNKRILVFDLSGGITDDMAAAYVLGQPDMISNTAALTQNGLYTPSNVAFDPATQRVYVTDNNRVLIYNVWGGITNGMNAAYVLGQSKFTTAGFDLFAATPNGMAGPGQVVPDPAHQRLFVCDSQSARVTVFSESNLGGTPVVSCAASQPYSICGSVTSSAVFEDNVPLANMPVQLRNAQGTIVTVQKTDISGNFDFGVSPSLTPNSTYYVTPVVGRTESADPLQIPVQNLQSVGAQVNFQIRGWPRLVQFNAGSPSSFLLISTTTYIPADPPVLNPGAGVSGFYTTVTGPDGTAGLSLPVLPGGAGYYLTCWKAHPSGASLTYTRAPATNSSGSFLAQNPGGTVTCP